MEKFKKQIKSELKQLPFTLGKLAGGVMAVIGFPGMIVVITRKSNPSFSDILPYLVLGISGVFIFLIFSRLIGKRMNKNDEVPLNTQEKKHISLISWAIFVIFIAIFILITFIMNR